MGCWHARALARTGGLVALVIDQDLDRARRLARRWRGCVAHSHLDELSAHSIRVAHICTPTASHAAVIQAALEAGCHVLAEKPLANDEPTTRALLRLAESRRLLLCPVHQALFQPGVRRTLAALDRLGPLHVDLVMCSAGAQGCTAADDQLIAEILPHPLSFLARVVPGVVDAGKWMISRAAPGELRATITAPSGTASILVSAHGRPTVNAARIIGERGTAHMDLFHGFALFQSGAVSRTRKAAQPLVYAAHLGRAAAWNLVKRAIRRHTAYPGLWELVSAFYGQLGPGGVSPISVQETLQVAAMRDAVLTAARQSPGAMGCATDSAEGM
jgi:predicted dehydrogenase